MNYKAGKVTAKARLYRRQEKCDMLLEPQVILNAVEGP